MKIYGQIREAVLLFLASAFLPLLYVPIFKIPNIIPENTHVGIFPRVFEYIPAAILILLATLIYGFIVTKLIDHIIPKNQTSLRKINFIAIFLSCLVFIFLGFYGLFISFGIQNFSMIFYPIYIAFVFSLHKMIYGRSFSKKSYRFLVFSLIILSIVVPILTFVALQIALNYYCAQHSCLL